ncbi:hypothetical protein KR038_008710 [Drosophila bunnanda]|nr:hypothetical protein KR038_008710 [Drosophila bunnanda]
MMKRIRMSAEGLSRMQSELTRIRGTFDTHQGQRQNPAFQHHPSTSEFGTPPTSATMMDARTHRCPELVPPPRPRKKDKSDMQNLANIILHQAHRIEKQQQELHCLKLHYERQVSTIKSNAKMLEQQLEKLQSNVNKSRALHLGNHYKEIYSAVKKLQRCGLDLSQPQTISNHLLTKLLTCNINQSH